MRVWGCNVTAGAIYFVEVSYKGGKFSVAPPKRLATPGADTQALSRALETVRALLVPTGDGEPVTDLAFFGCMSGQRGSSVESIKAETIVQLAADSLGIKVHIFHPASFYKSFKNADGRNWSERARGVIDPERQVPYWNSGVDGAICAAARATDPTAVA